MALRPRLQLAESFVAAAGRSGETLPAKSEARQPPVPAAANDAGLPAQWAEADTSFVLPMQAVGAWIVPMISFVAMVALPLMVIAIYLFAFASPQYLSEFRFSVTEVTPPTAGGSSPSTPTPSGTSGGSMAAMASAALGGGGVHGGSQQNYVVIDYLKSRQVIDELSKKIQVDEVYGREDVDWWSRFNTARSRERLVDYWQRMVTTNYDPITGLAKVEVYAFTPEDAFKVASNLVDLSEILVNDISGRSRQDAVTFAEAEVVRSRKELDLRRADLAAFRAREGVIDPTPSVVTTNITVATTLQTMLSQLEADRATLKQQNVDERSPAAQAVTARINATKLQIQGVEREVANDRTGRDTLAKVVAQFDKLEVERQYAQSSVLNALQNLDRARSAAAAQHMYLTPYVRPVMPTSAAGPLAGKILTLCGLGLFSFWLCGLLIFRAIRQSAA